MNIFVGLIILLTGVLVIMLLAFIFSPPKKTKTEKKIAVPKIQKRVKAPQPKFKTALNGGIIIPPGIPRTIDTIKIMTQDSPDLVVGIVKSWLREKS